MLRFVMFGFFASGIVMVSGVSHNETGPQDVLTASSEQSIDPIITGRSITMAHKQAWKLQNEKYKECGLCAVEEQPYPGD